MRGFGGDTAVRPVRPVPLGSFGSLPCITRRSDVVILLIAAAIVLTVVVRRVRLP
jgi:hypothetical protein